MRRIRVHRKSRDGGASRLSYANVVASLALFLAVTGGTAFAARAVKHYLLNNTSQIKPSVLKQLKGRDGINGVPGGPGATGAAGAPGAAGATGGSGTTGPAGPLLRTLPSGATETGSYAADGTAPTTAVVNASASISFPFPLAVAPTANLLLVGSAPTVACPGSASAPSAAAGQLCVYEASGSATRANPQLYSPLTGASGASANGVAVYFSSNGTVESDFFSSGSWAVTAP